METRLQLIFIVAISIAAVWMYTRVVGVVVLRSALVENIR